MNKDDWCWIGILIGIGFMSLIIVAKFIVSDDDAINTKALGTILCREHGMEYIHRTFIQKEIDKEIYRLPQFHCRIKINQSKNKIIDDIVVEG